MVICVEGIDGAGKTTVINEVARRCGHVVVYRRCEKGKAARKLLASRFASGSAVAQSVIYTLVAWRNYLQTRQRSSRVLLMDRCAMSNICYFFPRYVSSSVAVRLLTLLEPPMRPDIILVLKVEPTVAWERCWREKKLGWLERAAACYYRFVMKGRFCGCPVIPVESQDVKSRVELIMSLIGELDGVSEMTLSKPAEHSPG